MPYVIVALLVFDGFFGQLFPDAYGFIAYLVGLFLIALWFLISPEARQIRISKVWLGWLLVAALALSSHLLATGLQAPSVLILGSAVVASLIASSTTHWLRPALAVLLSFSSVHVFATIAFYIRPELYTSLIRGRFFTNAPMARDYTSALTTHYSYNALLCVIALLVSVAWVVASRQTRTKVLMVLMALASLFALVLTTKRAHLLIAVLAIVIGVASSNMRGRFFKLTFVAAAAIIGVFASAQVLPGIAASLDRVLGSFQTEDLTALTSGRTLLWDYAFEGWAERPLLGNGWATYSFLWPSGTQTSVHAHNALVNALYEVGIIGTLLLLVVVASTTISALKLRGSLPSDSSSTVRASSYFAVMCQAFLVVYAFTSGELFRSSYTFIPYLLAVTIVLAVQNDVHHTASRHDEISHASPAR